VHLEGSIRPATLLELAERYGAAAPAALRRGRWTFADFADFIAQYAWSCECLRVPDDFVRIGREFCEDAADEGVRYAEVTFTIASHAVRYAGDWDTPIEAVLEGFRLGRAATGVTCRLVLDHDRGFPIELADATLEAALRHRDGVVALGLGADERHPPEPYGPVFQRALAAGLHSVPHAGEAAGPASIWGALRTLGAERIGHGIRALEDPLLVAELKDRQVPLEVCLTSNVRTAVVPSIARHPLRQLLAAGLVVTLNSDDPAMFDSPLLGEYELARNAFAMTDEELAQVAIAGVRASFMEVPSKVQLAAQIDEWLHTDS
jgi:adenosine deaminase